jgi:deoxyribodipyrimidine photo-lyase
MEASGRMNSIPAIRIQACNASPVAAERDYILYWMIAFRRPTWNYSLQRAVEWAVELNKPLVIFEPLRIGYRWASDRLHSFVIEGMADTCRELAHRPVLYYPYVEPTPGAGSGLLAALAEQACVIVTDDFPCFYLPRMVNAAAAKIGVRLEQVDSNGILPLRATDEIFKTAYSFRRFLQQNLHSHLRDMPAPGPLHDKSLPRLNDLPHKIRQRWPCATESLLKKTSVAVAKLPIDHSVGPAPFHGGTAAAQSALRVFLDQRLARYHDFANHPDMEVRSGLSPYLHFGHIASHEIFSRLMDQEQWSSDNLSTKAQGKRSGWWGVSETAEAFLDQLITWRELGFNMTSKRTDYDQFDSLPDWAQKTLAKHATDSRPHLYRLEEFAQGQTHDALWNLAQKQLVQEGRMHNYLRMLWGKKILEWTASPRDALDVMIELNNRYAVDGRDPNSYSGIFWVLGRYDRPWGPERPIFGTVRYMSSANTVRKFRLRV